MEAQYQGSVERMAFALPFLTTAPLTDVVLLFWLLPLWWVLGVEQIIWPVALTWSAFKLALGGGIRPLPRPAVWLILFLLGNVLSGFFIVESYRYVTLAGHLAYYWGALCLLVIVWNEVRDERSLRRLLRAMVAAVTMSAVLGVAALVGFSHLSFHALLTPLIPPAIANTGLGQTIINRTISETSWLSVLGKYQRVHGMFLFATMSAMATAAAIPVALLLARTANRLLSRCGWYVACLFMAANLIGTTGRMAILALILGALYWFWRCASFGRLVTAASLAILVAAACLVAATQWSAVAGKAATTVQTAHEGSLDARSYIYGQTLSGIEQRPVLGWGTQRDIPGSHYPAGSHSYYLGILYRNGAVGLLILLALLVSVWRASRVEVGSRLYFAASFMRWSFLALLINNVSDIMDLDLTTFIVAWTIISAATVIPRLNAEFPTPPFDPVATQ